MDKFDHPPKNSSKLSKIIWYIDLFSARLLGDPGPGDLNRYIDMFNKHGADAAKKVKTW